MQNGIRYERLGKISTALATLCLSGAAMAGAVERGSIEGSAVVGSKILIVMVDVPMIGFATRRLVRMPVVFPVPAI
jgi:hypothetical protein